MTRRPFEWSEALDHALRTDYTGAQVFYRKHGVSPQIVLRRRRELGLPMKERGCGHRNTWTPERDEILRRYREDPDFSLTKLVGILKVSRVTIERRAKDLGIPKKRSGQCAAEKLRRLAEARALLAVALGGRDVDTAEALAGNGPLSQAERRAVSAVARLLQDIET